VIVVDASVVAPALADDGDDGDRARTRLRGERLLAPELLDLEVMSALRRAATTGHLDDRRARLALDDFTALDIGRVGHRSLIERIWALRANVTPYDAAYVALAEALAVVLVTADARLARASGPRCVIELLESA
jgi:predicted nucleic acid-binding protein